MSCIAAIHTALLEAREQTLALFRDVDEEDFRRQIHPDFSPLGWHLGHIGVTESFWILQQCKNESTLSEFYDSFFTPTDNPKPNRVNLPPRQLRTKVPTRRQSIRTALHRVPTTTICTFVPMCHVERKDGAHMDT